MSICVCPFFAENNRLSYALLLIDFQQSLCEFNALSNRNNKNVKELINVIISRDLLLGSRLDFSHHALTSNFVVSCVACWLSLVLYFVDCETSTLCI